MTQASTTIRVSVRQRERLRVLVEGRGSTMAATLDDALEALRRLDFCAATAAAERELRNDPAGWGDYVAQRDGWLEPDPSTR